MAITNTTNSVISGGTGATISMSNVSTGVYNTASDFIYGIPSHVWCGLSAMDQRYHAEKWYEREQARKVYEEQRFENRTIRGTMDGRVIGASEPMKPLDPEYMTNKLLLLEN